MIKNGWIYYRDREKVMQKYGIDIPEFPILPDSAILFIVFDDLTKKCKRYEVLTRMLIDEEDSV